MNPFRLLREINNNLLALRAQGNRLEGKVNIVMANQADLDTELDTVFTEVDQEFDQVIQLLKDKPNPTPQDTAATIARLEAFRGGVKDKLRDALATPPPAPGGTPPA